METNSKTISCYDKLIPRWVAILVLAIGIAVAFFLSPKSWVFYFWIALCGLFIYMTFSQKKGTIPRLEIADKGIRLDNENFYSFNDITKVMAFSRNRLKFRSISFKLYLKNGSHVEFPVDNLDVKPQLILDSINARLMKQ